MNEQKWFQVSEEKDVVRVEFIPGEDRYWEPGVLADCPLPEFSRSRRVELSGQGAVWMYAHAAATAAGCGAPSVTALSAAPAGRSDELGRATFVWSSTRMHRSVVL